MSKRIVLVGHCGPDAWALKTAVERAAPGAEVTNVQSSTDLGSLLEEADLLLVNRVLDGDFGTGNGVELIGNLNTNVATMLVSNFTDAQAAAEAAGAKPGFGKSDLYAEETTARIQAALAE